MAEPGWTSKDTPAYTIAGDIVTANQGNWQQGQAEPSEPLVEPRYVFVWSLDGNPWYGTAPPKSSPPDVRYEGEGHSVAQVPTGRHHVRFDIYVGTHSRYVTADGTVAYDVYEWGHGNVVTGEPYTVEFDIVVGPAPPTPLQELLAGVVQLEGSTAYKRGFANVVAGTKKCRDALTRLGG